VPVNKPRNPDGATGKRLVMPYAKTSLRKEKRELRERMRALGLDYRQIATEFARAYHLRPRAAWRAAYGFSQTEAAQQFNVFCGDNGLDPNGLSGMTAAHLSEYENWPGHSTQPTGRKPSPYLLAVLAAMYGCQVAELIDFADRSHLPPDDLLVIDTYSKQENSGRVPAQEKIAPISETWQSPAGDSRKVPNLILRRVREQERHETRGEFAEALELKAREMGESVHPSERYVARLEDGDIRYPHPAYRRVLVALCGRSMTELGFTPGQQLEQAHSELIESAPDEREGSTALPSSSRSPTDSYSAIQGFMAWVTGTNTTDDAIEQLAHTAEYLAGVHSQLPPVNVLSGVLQAHRQAQTYLQGGKQRLRQTRELLRIESGLLAHACLLLGDLGQNGNAAGYGAAALLLAKEAGSDEGVAWSVQAKTARWQGRYVVSAELARRGFEVSALSPIKAELAYREANAIALFGDARRAREALRRAERTADALPEDNRSGTSPWTLPVARRAIFSLSVAIHTGDADGALRAAALANEGWANGEPRNPATWAQIEAGSGIAYLMKDSLDGAVRHVKPVLNLSRDLRISTVTGYLEKLYALLLEPRHAESRIAIELRQQIRAFISSSPVEAAMGVG
jgi:hypothetical protein